MHAQHKQLNIESFVWKLKNPVESSATACSLPAGTRTTPHFLLPAAAPALALQLNFGHNKVTLSIAGAEITFKYKLTCPVLHSCQLHQGSGGRIMGNHIQKQDTIL